MIGEVSGIAARFRFSHALIRDVLYEAIPSALRVVLHRRAGEALESLPEEERASRLAELAHHFYVDARRILEENKARARVRRGRAGDDAMARLAYEDAARLYEMALQQLKLIEDTQGELRCELLLSMGDAKSRAGDLAPAREAFADAPIRPSGRATWTASLGPRSATPVGFSG